MYSQVPNSNAASSSTSSSSSGLTEVDVTKWMLAQQPPIEDWRRNVTKAIKVSIGQGALDILKAMDLELSQLNWLWKVAPSSYRNAVQEACETGQLEALRWLHQRGCRISYGPGEARLREPCLIAAVAGHLHILEYLRDNGVLSISPGIIDFDIVTQAAYAGNFEVVTWLLANGAGAKITKKQSLNLAAYVMATGSIDFLESLEASKFFKWKKLLNHDSIWHWAITLVCQTGKLSMLDYAVSRGWKPKPAVMMDPALMAAICDDQPKILRWFWDKRVFFFDPMVFHEKAIYIAARFGSLETLLLVLEATKPSKKLAAFKPSLLRNAASNRDVRVGTYLHEQGCGGSREEDLECFLEAVSSGNLEFLQWLLLNNTFTDPFFQSVALNKATLKGQLKCLRYLKEELKFDGIKTNLRGSLLHEAIRSGDIDIVRWLVESNNAEVTEDTNGVSPITLAEQQQHEEILVYLQSVGSKSPSP